MSNLKVTGKITKVLDKQTGTSKDGKEWVKLQFLVDNNEKYNNIFCFEVFGQEKVENFEKYNKLGDVVDVEFNVNTNEWQGKYFTSLASWKIMKQKAEGVQDAPFEMTDDLNPESSSDLPFQQMNSITINTKVVNGVLKQNRTRIQDAVKSFEGKEITITIKRKRKTRSNSQNAYYWSCLIPLMVDAVKTEWGEIWSNEKAHEFFKNRFLFHEKVNENTGEIAQTPKSTTENTTVEMEDYHSQIREFLKEWFNVDAPLPNEEIILNL